MQTHTTSTVREQAEKLTTLLVNAGYTPQQAYGIVVAASAAVQRVDPAAAMGTWGMLGLQELFVEKNG